VRVLFQALFYVVIPAELFCQTVDQTIYDKIRASMAASIEKQRASVQTQMEKTQTVWVPPVLAAAQLECEALPEGQLTKLVDEASKRESLKPDLLRAVILKESAARPCAVSPKGAQGLMQIMPATADVFKVTDPFDPQQNVNAGSKLLKQLLDKYGGDVSLALGAYNAGAGRVDREGGVPQIAETQAYVADILSKIQ
jgi:soluble lytic murein transglycosylase-like protein